MRLPRIRITVRRLMVAVLASALPRWWFVGRPAWFERISDYHEEQYQASLFDQKPQNGDKTIVFSHVPMMGEWHLIMSLRYRQAARHYWMPLGPDPRKPRAGDVLIADPFDQHHEWHFGTWEELRKVQLERERRRRLKGEI
jgi:hypothetical protein